jgi:hypothetical protein
VVNTDLLESDPLSSRLCLNLGIDKRPWSRQIQAPEEIPAKELERAVDVTEMDAKKDPHADIERLGEYPAMHGVAAFHPKSGDDVIVSGKWRQKLNIADIELAIGIHEHHEIAAGSLESTPECRAIATVLGVSDELHPRIPPRDRFDERSRAITAAVVDNDDLELLRMGG